MFGASTADDRGNVTAYASYRINDQVLERDRDFSACALQGPPSARQNAAPVPGVPAGQQHFLCGGSSTSFPGRFTNFGSISQTIDQTTGLFTPFVASIHQFNFGPSNYFQRPDERYTLGAFANYEINDHVEVYAQAMFGDYRSVAQIAPSGNFFSAGTNCANPLLPANVGAIGCTPAMVAADAMAPVYIGRRNVEGGGRQDDLNYETYRIVGGVRGALTDTWDYDVSGSYSRVNLSRTFLHDFSITRLGRALNVSNAGPDGIPGNGDDAPICKSVLDGTDPQCVPWDIFTPGGVTQAQLDYLEIPLLQLGETIQQNVVATATGELPWGSPAAESNIAMALGIEYRQDILNSVVDSNFSSGDGSGQGGPTLPLSGETGVFDIFTEARIPLVEGAPLADLLSIDLAYRYSDYDNGETTDTYKVGGEWAPTEDVRFRASFQRAVRAPNIIELFASQGAGLFSGSDPCDDLGDDGLLNNSVPALCIAGNVNPAAMVTAAQSDSGGLSSPAGQYNGFFGGNPLLSPETSDTLTIGFVATPSFLPGLVIAVDYFDIEVVDLIATTGAQNTINDCYATNNPVSCGRITRNPNNGALWVGSGQVEDLNTNIGGLHTVGYDFNIDYGFDIGSLGSMSLQLLATYLEDLIVDEGAATGNAPYNCVGFFASDASCGTPNPQYRHRFRVSWETPWDIEANVTWRYYDEVTREVGQATPVVPGLLDSTFPEEHYFDVAGNWQMYENTRVRFGVNNIMDNDPAISFSASNGNTYPQIYDSLGRWVFIGVTADF
jgi:outer membrane receptor protein involved in Fe transport